RIARRFGRRRGGRLRAARSRSPVWPRSVALAVGGGARAAVCRDVAPGLVCRPRAGATEPGRCRMSSLGAPVIPLYLAQLRLGGAGWWGLLLAGLLGALAFWLYRRQLRETAGLRRILLPSLRGAAVAAITLMIA